MSYAFEHTPQPPAYAIAWAPIARLPWVAAMAGVQQEPEWHAEGDVLTHTRMVAEAMVGQSAFQSAGKAEQQILFAAALLHDVAKPACTRFEEGRWSSPRHAKVGEGLARRLLWAGNAGAAGGKANVPPFQERERIAKLVRYHGLPLRFMDRPGPDRALVLASLEVSLRDVATVALADVLGRECRGREQLVESVRLFTEYAAELGCLDGPYPFKHGHHRFMYCVGRKPIDYVPHLAAADASFEPILMSGLPGSGKTTITHRIAGDRAVIRLDDIRQQLRVDGGDDQSPVVAAAHELARGYLRAKRSFIWDATNISHDLRAGLIALFANYGATTRIVYAEAPSWSELFARNRARPRPVPETVIERLAERLEIPSPTEAHAVDYVV